MNYYVFRIDYGNNHKMIRNKLFKEHELRQGWGGEGFDLNQSLDQFIESWEKKWDPDNMTDREYKKRKYNNLSIMKEISVGDIIIIPKLNEDSDGGRYFTIVRCEGTYEFDPLKIINYKGEEDTDFGHLIRVDPLKIFSYNANNETRIISAKFKAYQSAINRVYNGSFIEAVNQLLGASNKNTKQNMSPLEALSSGSTSAKDAYLQRIVKLLNEWSSLQFEETIVALFEKQGYVVSKRNHYDREGGDIDIVFNFTSSSFMSDLINLSSTVAELPEIRVQAKKKRGKDTGDDLGVKQLLKMQDGKNALNILINTTDEFSDEARELANKNVLLINGIQFAALLVKYGLDSTDDIVSS